MKTFTTILFAVFTAAQICSAQSSVAKVSVTKVIDASVDNVWKLVRQMDDIHQYTVVVGDVEWEGKKGVGGRRVCLPPKGQEGGVLNEEILQFSDANRFYEYSVEGVPTTGMVNSFKVVDLGYNKSMIVWNSTYDSFVENPQMNEEQLKAFLTQTLTEILNNFAKAAI